MWAAPLQLWNVLVSCCLCPLSLTLRRSPGPAPKVPLPLDSHPSMAMAGPCVLLCRLVAPRAMGRCPLAFAAFTWEVRANDRSYHRQFKKKFAFCLSKRKYSVSQEGPGLP